MRAPDGRLIRNYREGPSSVLGFADDYAFMIAALLDVYEVNGNVSYLKWAIELQKLMDEHFWDEQNGGYFSTGDEDPTIVVRLKEEYDGAEPSPVRGLPFALVVQRSHASVELFCCDELDAAGEHDLPRELP